MMEGVLASDNSGKFVLATTRDAAATGYDQSLPFLLDLLPTSCWCLVVDLLSARDLLCLALSSKLVKGLLCSVPGLWVQAYGSCLALHSSSASPSPYAEWSSTHTTPTRAPGDGTAHHHCWHDRATADQRSATHSAAARASVHDADDHAHHVLCSLMRIAHVTETLKPQLRPQLYSLPPWLAAQPGKARGFTQVQCPWLLEPALALSETQLHWLSWGYPSGHSGGVFVSQCSCSPRSRKACGLLAAVVINKQLLAELYFPHSGTAPDRWSCMYEPAAALAVSAASAGHASCAAAQAQVPSVQFELWLSQQVVFDTPAAAAPGKLAATAAPGRARGRRNMQSRGNSSSIGRNAGSSSSGVRWRQVHALLMDCIASNASRIRAVTGTAAVPPGSNAAAVLELHLAHLASSGAPLLDLRRMQYTGSTAGMLAAAVSNSKGSSSCSCSESGCSSDRTFRQRHAATQSSMAVAGCTQSRGVQRHKLIDTLKGAPEERLQANPGSALAAAQQRWYTAAAAVQAAITAAVAERTNNTNALQPDDDCLAEVLASVVQQLHRLAPDVQILVLPILLPGGRVGQKVPRGPAAGSRLSAPRLLSLNVPYLVPLRHEWDKLPQLKQVLLMTGSPAALLHPVAGSAAGNMSAANRGLIAGRDGGGSCTGHQLLSQLQHAAAMKKDIDPRPPLVRGVFLQEQLEQRWQQQAVNQQVDQHQLMQQQWDEDEWFQRQVGQQQQQHSDVCCSVDAALKQILYGDSSCNSGMKAVPDVTAQSGPSTADGHSADSCEYGVRIFHPSAWGSTTSEHSMSGYAVEAVHGMLLSCMDRLGLNSNMQ